MGCDRYPSRKVEYVYSDSSQLLVLMWLFDNFRMSSPVRSELLVKMCWSLWISHYYFLCIQILPNLWAVHHDPENFENPHDFVPERFINSDGKFKKDPRVIPFSIGPRFCLGEHLARMEVFLFLTSLVQRFQICADPSKPLPAFNDGIFGFAYVPNKFSVSFKPR